jgi:hypothetical protein
MVFVKDVCGKIYKKIQNSERKLKKYDFYFTGIICLIFTYLALFYADYVVTRWIIMTVFTNS